MTPEPTAPALNSLLESLPRREKARLLGRCDNVALVKSQVLYEAGDNIPHIHFPTSAFVSLISTVEGHDAWHAEMVGHEGAFGYELAFDVDKAPLRTLVHGAGMAWRLTARSLKEELARSAALKRILNRYVCALLIQTRRSSACNHLHLIEERLARWLLTTQDCARSPNLVFTHEQLSRMLGVRRVGITNAATALQARELIEYRRGVITITDRAGLEAASCGCYRANRLAYTDLMERAR